MSGSKLALGLIAGLVLAGGLSVPARANVVYTFNNFTGDATSGSLVVNFPTVAAADNQNGSIAAFLVNLTLVVNGQTFTITPANLASGSQFQTGSAAQIFTLTAEQNFSTPTPTLEMFTSTWQIHSGLNGGTLDQGSFSIAEPPVVAAAVPEPSTWAMMILGFLGIGFTMYRRSHKHQAFAAA